MASKAPPPLIRSSKAFSVEIPEGSNSAKSRRSDVVPNDDLDIHKRNSNFLGDDAPIGLSQGFQDDETHGKASAFGDHQEDLANAHVHDGHDGLKDRFATDDAGMGHTANMVTDDHDEQANLARLPEEDHHAPLKGVGVAKDAIKDNMQGVGNEALHDQMAGVGNEALHDTKVGIADPHEATHKQAGLAKDAIKDNLQGVANEALHDQMTGVANEALHDQMAGMANEALHDQMAGVANEAIKDNLQGVGNEALQDKQAGIPKDAIQDHQQGIGKEHLQDHMAQLPQTERVLADGPKPGMQQQPVSGSAAVTAEALAKHPHKQNPSAAPSVRNAEEAVAHAEAQLHAQQEKAKKIEEFHGRVEAIRKTVSGINHKLDELDEDPTSPKH